MRDFAKNVNKSSPPSSNKQQSRANKTKNTEKGAYQGRKILLSIVLLVLIILFLVSFFHSNDNENKPAASTTSISVPVTTDKTPSVTPTNLPNTSNDSAQSHVDSAAPTNANSTENKSNIDVTDKEVKEQTKPLTFSFYDTLTKKTVNVDVEPKPIKQYRYTYMLQIGSFRKKEDANATRAKLILAGLTPTVQKVGEWYRVDVGPVYSKRDGDIIKHKVEAAGISGSILRQVDKQEIKQNTADNKTTNKAQ